MTSYSFVNKIDKMKQIALTIKQMKHLKELGVDTSKASMIYCTYKDVTDEWVKGDGSTLGHFKIDESSQEITFLSVRDGKEVLYHDMNESSNYSCYNIVPTFTLQDILELLPNSILKDGLYYDLASDMHNRIAYEVDWDIISIGDINDYSRLHTERDENNFLDVCYRMLCWVAENGYLNKEE